MTFPISFRHSFRSLRRLARQPVFRLLVVLLLVWDSLHIVSLHRHQPGGLHSAPPPPPNTKRIYITSQHWNTERVLRERWNSALLALVQELGVANVFVTIYESGSWDDTKGALGELDGALGELDVKRNVTLSYVTHEDEIKKKPAETGWIETPGGKTELRRIPFLADLRNQGLQPLMDMHSQGQEFDMILFLNDVAFSPEDVLRLLDTNHGEYAAACSLDFSKPPAYYDTFALRDSDGHETVMQTWPYFRSHASRYAAERFQPVPVKSCWNGMVAMPAGPFTKNQPLRFRGTPDSLALAHVEGSECCLIHADNSLSTTKGVYLNPNVQVSYSRAAYDALHAENAAMSAFTLYRSIWKHRILRWFTTPLLKEWVIDRRLKTWRKESPNNYEPGNYCLINEMQILIGRGWKHV
ncbi:cryptococcal mannosyltransferase 1-domain-containing protein [Massariosphaeria phaeospora]|uniref:Cryptococcal mannosyltransferase 1-domain-containing protein n=1 Tax=Massariosphaeria phaeospora TaxID=100035 RepID=A0A7C8IL35_9PLEO|nr:cryptococcal mannosyltransferase 1-domain-containing protein [Massariosphaeria phaeospora]